MIKLKKIFIIFMCILLMSIPVFSAFCATPTTINDVYTVYKNDNYTILDFDVEQTYFRTYIVYKDGTQIDYVDNWSYGNSIQYQFQDYMNWSSLRIFPMSGKNQEVFYLNINDYNQQFYYDVDLQFTISEYSNIIFDNMTLYVLYYDNSYVSLGQDTLTYSINENGIYLSEESMLLCPAGTTRMLLYFQISFTGDNTSSTEIDSVLTLNKFRLQFTNNVATEIFDGLFNDPETEGEANDFDNQMNETINKGHQVQQEIESLNKPNPENIASSVNPLGQVNKAIYNNYMSLFTPLLNSKFVLPMLIISFSVAMIGYVLFGKKA